MKQLALHHIPMLKAMIKASCTAYATDTIKALEVLGFTNLSFKTYDIISMGFENVTIKGTYNGVEFMLNPSMAAGHWYIATNLSDREKSNGHFGRSKKTGPNLFRVSSIHNLIKKLQG